MKFIILAAGQGSRLRPLTNEKPKCLVELKKKPLLEWQLDIAHSAGFKDKDICIVAGYKIDKLMHYPVHIIKNDFYDQTNMLYSLFCAEEYFDQDIIISYGDILYSTNILSHMMNDKAAISVVADLNWKAYWQARFEDPLNDAESFKLNEDFDIIDIGRKNVQKIEEIEGQYIGLLSFKNKGLNILKNAYHNLYLENSEMVRKMYMTDFLQYLINTENKIKMLPTCGDWLEIDSLRDMDIAETRVSEDWTILSKTEA